MTCPECGAVTTAQYCHACGAPTSAPTDASADPPGDGATELLRSHPGIATPALRACPHCGAPNAASRAACGHCAAVLEPDDPEATGEIAAIRLTASPVPGGAVGAAAAAGETRATGGGSPGAQQGEAERSSLAASGARSRDRVGEAVERGPVRALVGISLLVAGAVAVVVLALLGARGIGPFAGNSAEVLDEAERVPIAAVHASTAAEGTAADMAVDGRSDTAWVPEGTERPWLELELEEAEEIDGVALWPAGGRRPATVRLVTDEHAFHATLLDLAGPVVVELPEPVPASRVRVEVLAGHETEQPGLAGVEARRAVP